MACAPPVFCTAHENFHGYFYDPGVIFDSNFGPSFQLVQGSPPITWTITGLPPGMTPQVTQGISNNPTGTATAPGTYVVTATATNACGTASRSVSVIIGNLVHCFSGPPLLLSSSYELLLSSSIVSNYSFFIPFEGCGYNSLFFAGGVQPFQDIHMVNYNGPGGGGGNLTPGHNGVDRMLVFDNTGVFPQVPGAAPSPFAPGLSYNLLMTLEWFSGTPPNVQSNHFNFSVTVRLVNPCFYITPPSPLHTGRIRRVRLNPSPGGILVGNKTYGF